MKKDKIKSENKADCKKLPVSVGGQALMNGILMRAPKESAFVVRMPDKSLYIEVTENKTIKDKIKIFKLPFLRGIINFIETLIAGYKSLERSLDMTMGLDEEGDDEKTKKRNDILSVIAIGVGSVIGLALAFALMFYLPAFLVSLLDKGLQNVFDFFMKGWLKAVIEGVLKLIIFTLYIILCTLSKDIKKVFMYHGAEHKTIFCYEKELPLTVKNVKEQSRFHPRCGTSFLIIMIGVSIAVSAFIPVNLPALPRTGLKIMMFPLILGIGYELLKICGKFDNVFTKIISWPGIMFQRLTTKEPDDDGIIEVGIAAFQSALRLEVTVPTEPPEKEPSQTDTDENDEDAGSDL